jgi:hypothetical protein
MKEKKYSLVRDTDKSLLDLYEFTGSTFTNGIKALKLCSSSY